MTYFTYLWTTLCRTNMIDSGSEGKPLGISAGNVFTKRGVRQGDMVYVLSVHEGQVYLIGRMKVAKIVQREQYDSEHDNRFLWEGDEVIIGEQGTPMRLEFPIPSDALKKLRFDSHGSPSLIVENGKLVEPQSLRSVRRLSWESVAELDRLLASS